MMKKGCLVMMAMQLGMFFIISYAQPALSVEGKTLKLGTGLPLSGPVYSWGVNFDRYFRKAAEGVNEAGGMTVGDVNYKWEVITYDHGYVPARALDVTTRLIEGDKVDFLSIQGGGNQTILLDFLSKHKILHFACGVAHSYWIGPKWPLNFSYWAPAESAMWPVTKYLGNLGIKTAVHVNPDDAHGRAHYAERAQQMEAVGVKSIGEDFYPRGATEFYPILRRLLAKNPDFLDTGTGGIRDEALLTKQARELGFKGPILVWAVSTGQLEKIVGKELLEGTLSTAPPPLPGLPMKGKTKELFDWYVSKFDVKEFDSAALSPYGIVELLTHAIKKAQSIDAFKVAGALEKINKDNPIETAVGKTYIDSLGFGIPRVMTFPFNVYLFKDGKWQEVGGGMPSLEWQKK